MPTDYKKSIKWVENTIQIYNELLEEKQKKNQLSRHDATFYNYNLENLTLIKEYLIDYQKIAQNYRELDKNYCILKLQKMEVDSRFIFEDMKKEYRANRRKWKAKQS
jgi:gp18